MDPFKPQFDIQIAFKNMDCLEEKPCKSMKIFEQELLKNMPESLINFNKIEAARKEDSKVLKKPSNKERLKRLEGICTNGILPVFKIPKQIVQK